MKKTTVMVLMLFVLVVSGAGLSYARQGGRGSGQGQGGGWNCPYRSAKVSGVMQNSQGSWYCPRAGAWTTERQHYGPMHKANWRGFNWNSPKGYRQDRSGWANR
ncbi:hypothetical protein [Desulfoferrobacter suflitae]|uniref:hypothetical protein n=1 Tax=Desulfoferrobacter suflitae TaxID=2865782 RepID=UPI00216401F7|nr:hypothetical protein [Desulfoferrobacter suflitae]MCK8600519.1 hypothetical protein [Desulfoferrobacter suflitae]